MRSLGKTEAVGMRFIRLSTFVIVCALSNCGVRLRAGTPQEPGFVDTFVENGLESPTSIAWAADGSNRLFVTLKRGGVRVIRNGALQPVPFAAFSQVHTQGECGVLGICFDPDYVSNRFVYVFVTVSESEQRIVRFTDVDSIGVARTVVIGGLPTLGGIHNGGAIGFGHDGKLYWAIGDNGAKRGVDGDLQTLASKVGRANADGSAPDSNPFFDGAGKRNDFIWATGFRNPFSMTFQPRTGRLWLNVVGSDPTGQTSPNSGPGYEQIFVVNRGDDAGYDDFEGNQPDGARYQTPFERTLAKPIIQYKTGRAGGALGREIASMQSAATEGGVRIVTTEPHPYRSGQALVLSNSGSFDGTFVVRRVLSPTELILTAGGTAAATTARGTLQPLDQGSCVVGACFYEASGFPAAFRGDFFYADYAGGRIMRARLDNANRPLDIRPFIADARFPVDTAVGPDGALYYAEFATGSIRKVAWKAAQQELLVSPTVLNLREGSAGAFAVRLRNAPAAETIVAVRRASGNPDLAVLAGGTLRFTAESWDKPQAVTIGAGMDSDRIANEGVFSISSPGLDAQTVGVSVTDVTDNAPLVSSSALEMNEGQSASFEVSLPRPPHRPVTATVRATNRRGAQVVAGGALIFTPENYARARLVRLRAPEDANRRNETTRIVIKARGYDTRTIVATSMDNDPSPPQFTTEPRAFAVVGLPYAGVVTANGAPAPTYGLVSAPTGMTLDALSGALSWTPPETGEFEIIVRAENGIAPAAEAHFTISVEPDQAPNVFITAPADGEIVRGKTAEFFGSALDDFGCWKCEFSIDGAVMFTDENRENHFHFGGSHNLWDTTKLNYGPHTLRMTVFDDKNQIGMAEVHVTVANESEPAPATAKPDAK